MIKRLFAWPGAVFALVFAWKTVLLVFLALPVPSNDSFFYDGPVVNFLLNDKYCNPSLAPALPISGTQVFSAYPPLYQAALLCWMWIFGTSVICAMAFHLCLFGAYMLVLLATFRRLNLPASICHLASLYLLLITFHDRPDSLGHLFGLNAVYAWIRYLVGPTAREGRAVPSHIWAWLMAGFIILSLATGLQVGAVYLMLIWTGTVLAALLLKARFPVGPMLASVLIPAALVWIVISVFPQLWAGFMEHVRQTPSLTGLRVPRMVELLKMARTVPGILAVGALVPVVLWRGRHAKPDSLLVVILACVLPALAITGASMVLLTPNGVFFAAYIQPLAVAAFLVWVAHRRKSAPHPNPPYAQQGEEDGGTTPNLGPLPEGEGASSVPASSVELSKVYVWLFLALAAVGSIRAVGLTTWAPLCAADVSYSQALHLLSSEIESCPVGSTVVLSSAYLYEGFRHKKVRCIHSDWVAPAERGRPPRDWDGLVKLKPTKVILTQFDYFRRYRAVLEQAKALPSGAQISMVNTAKRPAPDSIPSLQKVIQHISWAPVVVSLSWDQ